MVVFEGKWRCNKWQTNGGSTQYSSWDKDEKEGFPRKAPTLNGSKLKCRFCVGGEEKLGCDKS